MVGKEGGCHYAHVITAALKPGSDGEFILQDAAPIPGAERGGGGSF